MANGADFLQLLLEKLSTEERCIANVSELARQVIDQLVLLNDVVAVEGENVNRIDLLAYSKMATHLLLLNHGFILSQPTVFDSLDAGVMEYRYTFRYRTEFLYFVYYNVDDPENVRVTVTRKLNNIVQDAVVMSFHEVPQFSAESALNDWYKTEKVLVEFLKKICILWNNTLSNTSEAETPNAQLNDDSGQGPADLARFLADYANQVNANAPIQ